MRDSLAQLVELRIPDPKVGSSSLSRVTQILFAACSQLVRAACSKNKRVWNEQRKV